jgi:hypothetical protein
MKQERSNTHIEKCRRAEEEFAKVIENVCGRGFFGTATVSVSVQDGHIQNTRITVERLLR